MHPFPRTFYLEPTNYCNLACVMCPSSTSTRKRGYMDFNMFCHSIDNIPDSSYVNLYHSGEPLRHPRIVDMVSYITETKPHIITTIATNATLLSEDLSERLIKAGLGIMLFSFDAMDKKIYENIRQGAHYEDVVANMKKFIEIKRKLRTDKPLAIVDLVKIKQFDQDMDGYIEQLISLGMDTVRVKKYLNWIDLKPEGTEKSPVQNKRCRFPFNTLIILWNGDVIPCCPDINGRYLCGNVEEKSMTDIWNGEKLNVLREAAKKGDLHTIDLCKNCQDVEAFSSCVFEKVVGTQTFGSKTLYGFDETTVTT